MADTLRMQLNAKWTALDQDASSWMAHWRDLCDFVLPRTARFLTSDRNIGYKKGTKIMNETATFSLEETARGMMSKITNPARPWIRLKTTNENLNKVADVAIWLDDITQRMLHVFIRSNLYTTLAVVYEDLLLYGTACFVIEKDEDTVIRTEVLPIGSYRLGIGGKNRVDTCYRELEMTRHQLVDKFGVENCSEQIRVAAQNNTGMELPVTVRHCVDLNPDYDPRSLLSTKMRYRSVWYEVGAPDGQFLRQSGFNSMAVIAPRWRTTTGDVYGTSPAMNCLGTIKELQMLEKRSMQLLDKVITPSLNVPVELRRREINQMSGGLNFVSNPATAKIEPVHQIQSPPIQHVEAKIQRLEERIRKGLYNDVFMAMNGIDTARTAEEIRARLDQKIQSIGPILLKLNDEMLDCIVERTFEIMSDPFFKTLLPPAPQSIHGAPLTVEYISELAQAMKLAGLVGIERVVGFAGNLAAMGLSQGLDALDVDEIMDTYADMAGAPVKTMNDQKTRNTIRQQRMAAQQQQQAEMQAMQRSQMMKNLGQTPTVGNNALTDMTGAIG